MAATEVSVAISPTSASMTIGSRQQFTATVTGAEKSTSVVWSVNGINGGSVALGTISSGGLYTAPGKMPSPASVTVRATSAADPTKSAQATVTILQGITVTVSPATATLTAGQTLQLTASVTGAEKATGVTWFVNQIAGGNATVGVITTLGRYTAPSPISAPASVRVTAVSTTDRSKSGSAVISLKPAVTISMSPTSVNLLAGGSQQFSAAVTGASNSAVTWSLSAPVGTISTAGLYTAPASVASSQTVSVIARSVADPTKVAQANATIAPPISVSVTPAGVSLLAGQTQQLTASVSGGLQNLGVRWSVNGIVGGSTTLGTVSATGLYTAPASISVQTTVRATAVSVENPSKSASAVITLKTAVSVAITPVSANVVAGGTLQFTAMVTGATNTAVTWSLSAPVGTISASGLYSAPPSISSNQNVSVIARSVVDPAKSAQSVVTITAMPTAGGLVAFPSPVLGDNLLSNPGFEQGKAGWMDNGFTADASAAHTGSGSIKVTDPHLMAYSQYAWRDIPLEKGSYRISGWIKLDKLGATKTGYARMCLSAPATGGGSHGNACTKLVNGTTAWTRYEETQIVISQDTTARLSLQVYGEPDGTAWFDDIELRREQMTLSVFMMYPNYRGILFDDQSQVARFHVDVDPPDSTPTSAYELNTTIVQDGAGRSLLTQTFPVQHGFDVSLDLSSLPRDLPYLVNFTLRNTITGTQYSYPSYRIVRQSASARSAMSVSVDQQNRFLLRGKPSFLLGVYDSGLGYTTVESGWLDMFSQKRRLFELPINLYLNYWYGGTPNSATIPMMNALQQYGIYNLTNANCFSSATAAQMGSLWFLQSSDATVVERAAHPGFAGFYAADECLNSVAGDTFLNAQRMRALQSGGIVFGTQLAWTHNLPVWRDVLDVIATDPYVIAGALPSTGYYPLNKVSEDARQTVEAIRGSRPFMTTIQFFQLTSNSRWPTRQELRSMSYAAIVEGSNGLFYWSLGARALAYVCTEWCVERSTYFDSLKSVMNEIRSLDPVLTALDQPAVLSGNSNPAVRTRVKQDGAKRYLIAFNTSGAQQTVTLSFSSPVHSVSAVGSTASLPSTASGFTDTLAGFEPKVYLIQ
jgi:hypothetical protein